MLLANDASLMQYAIKGSDEQWNNALDGKEIDATGTVSIRSVREKRKSVDVEDFEKEALSEHKTNSSKKSKKKKKSTRKQ